MQSSDIKYTVTALIRERESLRDRRAKLIRELQDIENRERTVERKVEDLLVNLAGVDNPSRTKSSPTETTTKPPSTSTQDAARGPSGPRPTSQDPPRTDDNVEILVGHFYILKREKSASIKDRAVQVTGLTGKRNPRYRHLNKKSSSWCKPTSLRAPDEAEQQAIRQVTSFRSPDEAGYRIPSHTDE